jgi:hypothetical protein
VRVGACEDRAVRQDGRVPAGYSRTPLPRKLGLRDGDRVALLDAPGAVLDLIEPQPADLRIRRDLRGRVDVVLHFVTERRALVRRIDAAARAVFPNGAVWVAWPKRSSGVPTDVTEDVVREIALPLGLVDNKVCAVDDTWSGLRLVWRREHRS